MNAQVPDESSRNKKTAFQIIILFGLVSLFGDIVYEGARSVNGPYLKILGANAIIVGLMAGLGELLGYALRLIFGYVSDRTKAYWLFTLTGYAMLASVPLLALTGMWQIAAILIITERIGKAVRSPARDTILSQASKQIGTGMGFGLHEAMDQIGAISGPLIFSLVFMSLGTENALTNYQKGYHLLWIPFLLVMACVVLAYLRLPNPAELEISLGKEKEPDKLSRVFWLYTLFSFVTTLGFVHFILMAYHFKTQNVLSDVQIPLFYAIAMGIDAIIALVIGKVYDVLKRRNNNPKAGLNTLILIPLLSALIPVLAFSRDLGLALVSVFIWGMVMGIHETIMRSAIADLTPLQKRGTGYGIFNSSYGLGIFLGSALMGILYEYSILALVGFAIGMEILAIPIFFFLRREALNTRSEVKTP